MIKKKQVTIFILILGIILIILGIFFQFVFVESNNQRYVEKECSKQVDSDNEDYEEKYITKIKINKSDKNAISFTNYELLQFNKKDRYEKYTRSFKVEGATVTNYDEKIQILIAYPEQYYKDENNHQVTPSFEEIKSSYEKDGYICED